MLLNVLHAQDTLTTKSGPAQSVSNARADKSDVDTSISQVRTRGAGKYQHRECPLVRCQRPDAWTTYQRPGLCSDVTKLPK